MDAYAIPLWACACSAHTCMSQHHMHAKYNLCINIIVFPSIRNHAQGACKEKHMRRSPGHAVRHACSSAPSIHEKTDANQSTTAISMHACRNIHGCVLFECVAASPPPHAGAATRNHTPTHMHMQACMYTDTVSCMHPCAHKIPFIPFTMQQGGELCARWPACARTLRNQQRRPPKTNTCSMHAARSNHYIHTLHTTPCPCMPCPMMHDFAMLAS